MKLSALLFLATTGIGLPSWQSLWVSFLEHHPQFTTRIAQRHWQREGMKITCPAPDIVAHLPHHGHDGSVPYRWFPAGIPPRLNEDCFQWWNDTDLVTWYNTPQWEEKVVESQEWLDDDAWEALYGDEALGEGEGDDQSHGAADL